MFAQMGSLQLQATAALRALMLLRPQRLPRVRQVIHYRRLHVQRLRVAVSQQLRLHLLRLCLCSQLLSVLLCCRTSGSLWLVSECVELLNHLYSHCYCDLFSIQGCLLATWWHLQIPLFRHARLICTSACWSHEYGNSSSTLPCSSL